MKTVGVHVSGRVQGVSFRAWTKVEAQMRGLSGWVRNEEDGSVRAVLAGDEDDVDAMVDAMRHGPPAAIVTTLDVEPAEMPEGGGFAILR
jgi:acylphosphatase